MITLKFTGIQAVQKPDFHFRGLENSSIFAYIYYGNFSALTIAMLGIIPTIKFRGL